MDASHDDPSDPLSLGRELWEAGRIDEAIPHLQAAKQTHPAQAGYLLARCFMKKHVFNVAVKELTAAREAAGPEDRGLVKETSYMLGRIYEQARKPDRAIEEYRRAAEL